MTSITTEEQEVITELLWDLEENEDFVEYILSVGPISVRSYPVVWRKLFQSTEENDWREGTSLKKRFQQDTRRVTKQHLISS